MPIATPHPVTDRPPWRYAGDDVRDWRSADGRRAYRVSVAVPEGEAPAAGYPALFLLDGDLIAAPLAAGLPALGEPVVAVLISHAPMGAQAREARAWDYTPAIPGCDPLADPRQPAWRNGGADDFLALLNDTIVPAVLSSHPIDRSRLTLYGHSYGALCVLRAVQAQRTPAFARYVAASPSVWWHDGAIARLPHGDAPLSAPRIGVLVLAGTLEAWHAQAAGPDGSPASRAGGTPTLPITYGLARHWAAIPHVSVVFEAVEGGTHHSMLAQSIVPAIDFARCTQAAIDAARLQPDLLETPS
ncbi:alpha/beta hydrolase [Schauerella aestuarii]|uniref:alpha/beta hydrolase n=1 Tax=Schauerella aestuarii TaxID=2511204 RepID=UPI00136D6EB8|nr:alpha/beta hydrolase-fold protein [Achromobacter aestuarii]MYZ45043.1 alpha/beta hydrolase [Achromobacter aestuarii]